MSAGETWRPNEFEAAVVYLTSRLRQHEDLDDIPIMERPVDDLPGVVIGYQMLAALDSRNIENRMVQAEMRFIITAAAPGRSVEAIKREVHAINRQMDSEEANRGEMVVTEDGVRWNCTSSRIAPRRVYPDLRAGGRLFVELGGDFLITAHTL